MSDQNQCEADDFEEDVPIGRCCACGVDGRRLPNLIMVRKRAPEHSKGWGCAVCGLPADGAMAAVCLECMPDSFGPGDRIPQLQLVCRGYVGEPERVPIGTLTETWEHDAAKHSAFEMATLEIDQDDDALVNMEDDIDEDPAEPFVCSNCRQPIWMPAQPPVLAWPIGADGEPLPDPNRPDDIQMLRLCERCAGRMLAPLSGGPE